MAAEQARSAETAAASALRILVGYDFTQPIGTADLVVSAPQPGEVDRLTADMVSRRPEFAQLQAERRAAEDTAKKENPAPRMAREAG